MSTPRPVLPAWPHSRPPWRALLALTALVSLLHLFVLGWLPLGGAREDLPLAHRFSTRTIVIAPPAATGGGAPAAAPAPTAPAASAASTGATARLRAKPRAATPPPPARPKPAPIPTPAPAPPPVAQASSPPAEPAVPEAPPEPAEVSSAQETEPLANPLSESPPEETPAPDADAHAPPPGNAPSLPAEAGTAIGAGQGTGEGAGAGAGEGEGAGAGEGEGAGAGAGVPGAREALKVPGSVRLDFAVTGQQGMQPMSGVFGELVWLQDGGSYNARLALRVLFRTIRTQTSVGRVGPGGIEPLRFSDARRGEVATHFMRESGQIVFSGIPMPTPLLPGAQDRLSIILQLSALLAGDPARHGPGSRFSIQTAGPRDAEVWQFSVDGDETLETPAGTYEARKLTRLPRKAHDQKIELWLAPALDWLPVRIRQTQANGDFADMQLRQSGAP